MGDAPAPTTTLSGTVRQEVFRAEDGGFAVLRLETPAGLATVAGPLPPAHPGETLVADGGWVVDPRFGRQFRAQQARVAPPDSADAVERYLGSGAVQGVGPELARRIVERFGAETVRVLDERPDALGEVPGIGKKRLARIQRSWADQRAGREVMLLLRGHGVGPVLAERIHARFGAETRRVLDEDPFRIAREVEGAGFLTADRLARALGLAADDPRRLRGGLLHVAQEAVDEGHTAVPADALVERARQALGASDPAGLEQALRTAREQGELELERMPAPDGSGELEVVYLPKVLRAERGAARRVAALVRARPRAAGRGAPVLPGAGPGAAGALFAGPGGGAPDAGDEVARAAGAVGLELTAAQAEAVRACLEAPFVVITGGPGVGKTTVLRALVEVLRRRAIAFALAAPTGRAARRLEEATGATASTLHRLLEWEPRRGGFARDADAPLDVDLLVVDEASMLDIHLFHAVARALVPGATLVLTGDVDQLPSVGPGAVLAEALQSGAARVVRLTEVFRQAARSRIVAAAHAVNRGEVPDLREAAGAGADPGLDFFFVERRDAEQARDAIVKLVAERIGPRFGLDPIDDVQVLAPMRRGACGTDGLNAALRAALRGLTAEQAADLRRLDAGDKVMVLRNDYDHDVSNGDLGRVVRREPDGAVTIRVDGREVTYPRGDGGRLGLAYCATIHKAQGSEYPAVVVPVLTEHFVMLERNLLYTAITRARRLVVLVGQRRAIELAVQNDRPRQRLTFLAPRLRALLGG